MKTPVLLDQYGRAVETAVLETEVARPTTGGVRSPLSGYPGDGLNPARLATILREADAGDPVRYLELAELIEERDPHYLGVLGTRRRSVTQLDITVDSASDAPDDVRRADLVRDWLTRDELADELFDILDCIGKGVSWTEILWGREDGVWMPEQLIRRDPRWFRFDRTDLETPMMLSDTGQEVPLPAFKFIFARIAAKSGLPLRSGLARIIAWVWMFKAFTMRDWAIFTQTYGQPLRLGKYGAGATEDDKATLFRAVSQIAGDCAAIVPESMMIEFVETSSVGASSDLYLKRIEHLDQQTSKAVIGQTATTDAVTGGLGSGKEHRQVQEDIERADAKTLSAILNRDLIRPWMQLNFGRLKAYPRLKIGREEQVDLKALAEALGPFIDRGLEVEQSVILDKFGLPEPKKGAVLLRPSGASASPAAPPAAPQDGPPTDPMPPNAKIEGVSGVFERGKTATGPETAPQAEGPSAAKKPGGEPADGLAARLEVETGPAMEAILARIKAMIDAAKSLPMLEATLLGAFDDIDAAEIIQALELGLLGADLQGRVAVLDERDIP